MKTIDYASIVQQVVEQTRNGDILDIQQCLRAVERESGAVVAPERLTELLIREGNRLGLAVKL